MNDPRIIVPSHLKRGRRGIYFDLPQACQEIMAVNGRYRTWFDRDPDRRPRPIRYGKAWTSNFSRKSNSEKMGIIRKPWHFPMAAQNLAAVEIQRHIRGANCRVGLMDVGDLDAFNKTGGPGTQMQRYIDATKGSNAKAAGPMDGYQIWCASRVQSWWRMLQPRWKYNIMRHSLYHIAAMQIQYTWRNYCQHKYINLHKPSPEAAAAAVLQRAWRRYTNLRIYRYYRDLITFRNAGDPKVMLKAINPLEAGLIDAAAGLHVRFRLGGHLFPPTIYYKMFTHNACCDIGAFAPRDYTAVGAGPAPQDAHNKHQQTGLIDKRSIRVGGAFFGTSHVAGSEDERGWYRRQTNNGWRPVTVKVLAEADNDPVARETAAKESNFHYSRLKRREDLETKRKNQKRQWMQKMYQEGLIKEAEKGPGQGSDDYDEPADFEDLDDEALLQWSSGLDYDKYVDNWHALATSGPPEVPEKPRSLY